MAKRWGGIGIMNIILVSDGLTQFLVESIVMSVIGGLLGVGLGYEAAAPDPIQALRYEERCRTRLAS
jgi:hypothetical protein